MLLRSLPRRLDGGCTEVPQSKSLQGQLLTLKTEHLGLMEPQYCDHRTRHVTSFMKPAPYPIEDESQLEEDRAVADPLADRTILLWEGTAKKNREVFTELFRPVPTNLVRSKSAYKVGRDSYDLEFRRLFLITGRVLGVPSRRQKWARCT